MFEFASFVVRNPNYALKNWRALSSVRRAINNYRLDYSQCAWCGTKKDLQVHHIIPVSVDPYLADDRTNLVCLCRTHHLEVAHNGNFRTRYTPDIKKQIESNKVIQIK